HEDSCFRLVVEMSCFHAPVSVAKKTERELEIFRAVCRAAFGSAGASVAVARAGVGEGPAGFRYELPVVGGWVKGQLQDPERVGVSHLAVGLGSAKAVVASAAGSDHELPYPTHGIRSPRGGLWREALVVMVVAREHDVGVRVVEVLPDQLHRGAAAVLAGREA